jgi:hypothetical protein
MWKLKKSSWVLFFGAMASSCLDQPDCFRLSSDQIGISFKVLGTNKEDAVKLTGIEITNVGDILGADLSTSQFLLPLNYLVNQTGVTISGDKINGTMLLKYLSQAQFVSDECGPRYILSALTIGQQSGFDSVRVLADQVSNPPIINVEIFRCPTTNLVKFDFYQLYVASNGKKASQLLTLKVDTIATNYSSDLFYLGVTTNTVTLPVNINAAEGSMSSAFKISYNDELDTVSVVYTLKQEERYNVCPPKMYVSALEVTSPDFDSVSIAVVDKKKIDAPQDPATTNVLIFQCPPTNLMRIAFKTQKGESFVAAPIKFNKITNNLSPAVVYYEELTTSSVELPIDESAAFIEYYFDREVADGNSPLIDTLRVDYDPINKTIFTACGVQKVYTNLKANLTSESPDFILATPAVPKDSIQFPSITNIEILKN